MLELFFFTQKKESQLLREERWRAKLERSPFHVDLVAEQERIDEVRGQRAGLRVGISKQIWQ